MHTLQHEERKEDIHGCTHAWVAAMTAQQRSCQGSTALPANRLLHKAVRSITAASSLPISQRIAIYVRRPNVERILLLHSCSSTFADLAQLSLLLGLQAAFNSNTSINVSASGCCSKCSVVK